MAQITLCLSLLVACGDDDARRDGATDAGLQDVVSNDVGARDAPTPDVGPASSSVEIAAVSLFQAIEIELVNGLGAVDITERSAPIVAGRSARLAIFLDVPEDWSPATVSARVEVSNGGGTTSFEGELALSGDSVLGDPRTAIAVDIPASEMTPEATYSISLSDSARFPAEGSLDFGAVLTGAIRVHVIPYRVNGFTPDVSEATINGYRDAMLATFPATSVEISVGEVRDFGTNDVGVVLIDVGRLQDRATSPDIYYYGMVSGVATREEFEGGTGISENGGDSPTRAFFAAGAAFGDARSESTFVHELGHVHGLEHSPCGEPPNVDAAFPNADGSIGVMGYDFRSGEFLPADTADLMGYCQPRWIGAYHYRLLAEHIQRAQDY